MSVKARCIVVESCEGAGKSTVAQTVKEFFEKFQIDFVRTREPGGTPLAEELRTLLLSNREEVIHPTTELLMMFASRAQHLNNLILPQLKNNVSVFSERFVLSSVAYQGYGRGGNMDHIMALSDMVVGDFYPDLTIILDLDPRIGMARAQGRGELDRIENEAIEFFDRARQGFLDAASKSPERFAIIDASQSIEAVKRDVFKAMYELYKPDLESSHRPEYNEFTL